MLSVERVERGGAGDPVGLVKAMQLGVEARARRHLVIPCHRV